MAQNEALRLLMRVANDARATRDGYVIAKELYKELYEFLYGGDSVPEGDVCSE